MKLNSDKIIRLIGCSILLVFSYWLFIPNGNVSSKSSVMINKDDGSIHYPSKGSVIEQGYEMVDGVDKNSGYEYKLVKPLPYTGEKEKACFVTLARNSDLYGLLRAIQSVEDRFNKKFQYDWVFLNDEEFNDEFKRLTSSLVSGETKYGLVPKEHWSYPDFIDQEKAAACRKKMTDDGIIYGWSESYRFMCRYESGLFFKHPLMDDYDWYWRVEPDVEFFCDIDFDVFKFMRDNNKKYAFTISIFEYLGTIPTLWDTTVDFMKENPELIHPNNMMDFISDDDGTSYNLCHFWSNFEIASLDFYRGEAYTKYFEYLDKAGGFFYERWGDAPVHSIAVSLLMDRSEIHHFDQIAYYHPPFYSCSVDDETRIKNKCSCNPADDFTWQGYSCTGRYYKINNLEKPDGWFEYLG